MAKINDLIFKMKIVLQAVEGETGFGGLDATSKDILFYVGQSDVSGEKINVTDIANNPRFGSPATVHGRISRLLAEGWLQSNVDPEDGRARVLSLNAPSVTAFNRMSSNLKSFLARG